MNDRVVRVLAELIEHTEGLEMDKLGEFWFMHESSWALRNAELLLKELKDGST